MALLFLLILAIPIGFLALGIYIFKKIIESAVKSAVKQAILEIKEENEPKFVEYE